MVISVIQISTQCCPLRPTDIPPSYYNVIIKSGIRPSPKHPRLPAWQIQLHLSAREIFPAQGLEGQCFVSMIPSVGYKHTPYILLRSVNCTQGSQRPGPLFLFIQVLKVALHFGSCVLITMKNTLHEKSVKSTNPQLFSSVTGMAGTGKGKKGEEMEKMERRFQICLKKV